MVKNSPGESRAWLDDRTIDRPANVVGASPLNSENATIQSLICCVNERASLFACLHTIPYIYRVHRFSSSGREFV